MARLRVVANNLQIAQDTTDALNNTSLKTRDAVEKIINAVLHYTLDHIEWDFESITADDVEIFSNSSYNLNSGKNEDKFYSLRAIYVDDKNELVTLEIPQDIIKFDLSEGRLDGSDFIAPNVDEQTTVFISVNYLDKSVRKSIKVLPITVTTIKLQATKPYNDGNSHGYIIEAQFKQDGPKEDLTLTFNNTEGELEVNEYNIPTGNINREKLIEIARIKNTSANQIIAEITVGGYYDNDADNEYKQITPASINVLIDRADTVTYFNNFEVIEGDQSNERLISFNVEQDGVNKDEQLTIHINNCTFESGSQDYDLLIPIDKINRYKELLIEYYETNTKNKISKFIKDECYFMI